MEKSYKLKFIKDFAPRKKGDVAEFLGREETRIAEHYLSIGVAVICCNGKNKGDGCSECEKLAKKATAQKTASTSKKGKK